MKPNVALLVASFLLFDCGTKSEPDLSAKLSGHCEYQGVNSKLPECKEYVGEWTVSESEAECKTLSGTFSEASACPETGPLLGQCLLTPNAKQNRILVRSADTAQCSINKTGCEFFGGGFWKPSTVCGGVSDELVVLDNAFPEPVKVCRAPKPGEAPGKSENGQICSWEGIHGATEEGRDYVGNVSCERALKMRSYFSAPSNARYGQPDSRRENQTYLAEEKWVVSQVTSQACTCCHSNAVPSGGAVFGIDRPGSFANQFNDRGLAQGAGWVKSIVLGALAGETNNGFQKSDDAHPDYSIFMSTDAARMKRFFEGELAHRKLTRADFEGKPDGFGPLTPQLEFRPSTCDAGEGVAADGTITWGKGKARYVYVMESTSRSPTVPPNLWLPEGILWRLDVPETGTPVASRSVKYAQVPEGLRQRVPANGAPAQKLVSGRSYYLYVAADVLLPITRCLFVAP
jgi:hypothetical protein